MIGQTASHRKILEKPGWEIIATDEEAYRMMMSLASGALSESQLSKWLVKHSSRLSY
jgi:prophage maintenance system killer protein